MIVGSVDPKSNVITSYKGDAFDNDRDIVVEAEFEPGDYAIYVEVEWN